MNWCKCHVTIHPAYLFSVNQQMKIQGDGSITLAGWAVWLSSIRRIWEHYKVAGYKLLILNY